MSKIYIIHENDEWNVPLRAALEAQGLPYQEWHLDQGHFDLSAAPPEGVFYSRMSASSHTRGHRYAPEYTSAVLAWLENHGRRVLNPTRALQLEINKAAQYVALHAHGIRTPKTSAAVGRAAILQAAAAFTGPFISKHNRAGKGLGVHLFYGIDELQSYLDSDEFDEPVDGITLLQQYIKAPQPYITRVEFVGREFMYAVRVDTSEGFELCPADASSIEDQFCPATTTATEKFVIQEHFEHPLLKRYQRFLQIEGIDVAAFEFIVDAQGLDYTYDINTNTNYNAAAEARAGVFGMQRLAQYLGAELAALQDASLPRIAVLGS
jgi:hypothetical protein